jgi:putative zinc finger protein
VTCNDIRPKLTAYLEGELEGDRGTVVRGHLRTCEACRHEAAREAKLRDELRALPPLDPPASLWAGVQERLAKTEIEEASQPTWRRLLASLGRRLANVGLPRIALGGMLAAATITIVMWRVRPEQTFDGGHWAYYPPPVFAPSDTTAKIHKRTCPPMPAESADVSDDLALDNAREAASYCQAIVELEDGARDARSRWTAQEAATFDAKFAELDAAVKGAPEGRPRLLAMRVLKKYLQGAATFDRVAIADTGGAR